MSAAALVQAPQRLGPAAAVVTWLEADVLTARQRYIAQVRQAVRPGGDVHESRRAAEALGGPS